MASQPDSPLSPAQQALLQHLPALYRVAMLLTQDADEASRLVEDVAHRYAATSSPADEADTRARLLRLLLETHADQTDTSSLRQLDHLHRRLAQDHVQPLLPVAFATLSHDQQLLLLLADVAEMPEDDVAKALDLPPATRTERHREAHRRLRTALYERSDEVGRELLRRHVPPDALPTLLRRQLGEALPPVSPDLRAAVVGLDRSADDAHEPEADTSEPASDRRRRFHRALISIMLVLVAGLAGWLLTELVDRPEPAGTTDLLRRSAEIAPNAETTYATGQRNEAEQFVQDHLGQRVALPDIRGTMLQGAGVGVVAAGLHVPFVVYHDRETGASVVLYTYTYALLDRHARTIQLAPEVLRQIEDAGTYGARDVGDRSVLVWRRRDDIYVAVAPFDARDLRQRLQWHGDA